MMKDFFISHSSLDKQTIVEDIRTKLESSDFSVWYDKDCILAGDDILKKISYGINEAYCMIIILTSNFLNSKWTHIEMGIFSVMQKRRIIPIVCEDNDNLFDTSTSFLKGLKYISLKNTSLQELVVELTKSLKQTKSENEDLVIIDELYQIRNKLNNYESCNAGLISSMLKDYLDFLNNHHDYIAVCAKRLNFQIAKDIFNHSNIHNDIVDNDYGGILKILNNNKIGNINIREYFNFLLSENVDRISTKDVIIINRAILGVLKWYIHFRYPTVLLNAKIEPIPPDKLSYDDFEEMYNIDTLVMRSDLIASIETTYNEWYSYNIFSHIAIKDCSNDKLIGYCAMLPITEETYAKILSGDFKDKDFNQDSIRQYDLPSDTYKLYVAGLAIHPKYQNTTAFTQLYNSIIDLLLSLAKEREIYISELIAEASTKQGEKLCKILNMKKRIQTIYDTNIYTLDLIPPEFRVSSFNSKILHEICRQKYEENRELFC
ncbi:MAG: toll/interleukin-1 receptor domain-containing protein [Firmicutes bacterium]|nr:toll/interleukin-1 receptor domain-containing protein [Bacillota bacterium]